MCKSRCLLLFRKNYFSDSFSLLFDRLVHLSKDISDLLSMIVDASEDGSKKYVQFLKTIEGMCCLYIIQFNGQARTNLVHLCKRINK